MSAITVEVQGISGIHKALRFLMEPEVTEELSASTKKAAQVYARALRPAARQVSRRMAKAVRVHRAKRDRTGWVVGSRRKIAFFWPFVIGGTRRHGARGTRGAQYLTFKGKDGRWVTKREVKGVPPNPIVERVATAVEAAAFAAASAQFVKSAKL